jgi:hypothetical protein
MDLDTLHLVVFSLIKDGEVAPRAFLVCHASENILRSHKLQQVAYTV